MDHEVWREYTYSADARVGDEVGIGLAYLERMHSLANDLERVHDPVFLLDVGGRIISGVFQVDAPSADSASMVGSDCFKYLLRQSGLSSQLHGVTVIEHNGDEVAELMEDVT